MSDLISRQAVKEWLAKWEGYIDADTIARMQYRVIDIPSAQQWIPCSERLPHMWDERYLVSLAWGGVGVMEFKSTGFHNYGSFSPVPIESVIAWMPLPEPYRAERRTDETDYRKE